MPSKKKASKKKRNVAQRKVSEASPFLRWDRVTKLVELCSISTCVANIEAPLNVVLVGPPGDGKTRLLLRFEHLPHLEVLSDATWSGLVQFIQNVHDGFRTAVLIPDLGTLVGRRTEVAKQAIATLAMLCAEGVRNVRVGKRFIEFGGASASVLSAITPNDLNEAYKVLNQNAFLSRVFLVNFDLKFHELSAMLRRKNRGDRKLVSPVPIAAANGKGIIQAKEIKLPASYAHVAEDWWREMRQDRHDRFFGFRTADALTGLLMASARRRNVRAVSRTDVVYVKEYILPLIREQVHLVQQEQS